MSSASATVSITVIAVPGNNPPVATLKTLTTAEDTAKYFALTGSDADGDALTYTVLTRPVNGSLTGTVPNMKYTPKANFNGTDSFTYKVRDGKVDSAISTVTITVTAVNDAPKANAMSVSMRRNTTRSITLSASDVDGDPLTYIIVSKPAHGTLTGSGKTMTYKPVTNYYGYDSFTYKVNDGKADSATVKVTITIKR